MHHHFEEPTIEDVRCTVGLTLEESMRRLTGNRCQEPLTSEMVRFYRALHTAKAAPLTRLFNGAVSVLEEVRNRKISTILVSNKGRAGLLQLIDQLEIASYFDIVLSSEDVEFPKPDSRLYTQQIVPLVSHVEQSQVLVVGDTETDILFAKNAGILSCWVTYGYGDEQRCKSLAPDFTIHYLTELLSLIAGIGLTK